jgi:Ti-type conjugative transfer relaxase TraA
MFHLRAKIIGRSATQRSVAGAVSYRVGSRHGAAAMAYRAGEPLRDPRSGIVFDYSAKGRIDAEGFGILHTEIMLPGGAPAWMADRQALIDAIEAAETRKDAQLLREIEVSLPRELTLEQQVALVRAFVESAFVSKGMVADIALHDERASDGGRNPHAHILLTMREVTPDGFGKKVRAWNKPALVREWRETWATMANEMLAALGIEKRLDHRAHKDRGIALEPDVYIGPTTSRGFEGPLTQERRERQSQNRARNQEQIAIKPEILIASVAREKATFTQRDLAYALRRATGLESDDERFGDLLRPVLASSELVAIAGDERGPVRFATREMIQCEAEMAKAAGVLAARSTSNVHRTAKPAGLSVEQLRAFAHAVAGPDLTLISGVAGTGKTTTLKAIAETLGAHGHRVRGAALAGIAATRMADEAGIEASTLASLFYAWDRGAERGGAQTRALQKGDVLIVDEAGMVESRDMRRLLREAEAAEARVILVGDAQQLQAIGAGAPFRALKDTHGAAELREVRRQRADWMKEATSDLHQGDVEHALRRYGEAGALRPSATSAKAMDQLIDAWRKDRSTGSSQLILSYYTADVDALNTRARAALRAEGKLGPDIKVQVRKQERDENGEVVQRAAHRVFAVGDRILFTRNSADLGIQNGSLGDVQGLTPDGRFNVRLDNGKAVAFDASDYGHITQGYAVTIHKAQSATVDRSYVFANDRMNAQLVYVALTRHREETSVFFGRDQVPTFEDLVRVFSRQRVKDSTLDYLDDYQQRRRNAQRKGDTAAGAAGRTDSRPTANTLARSDLKAAPPRELTPAERVRANLARKAQERTRGRERTRRMDD